jgi:DNA-binding NarL/FixJ family response regulator
VAAELGLGLSAEKHRVQKLFRKLGVETRNELFAKASDRAGRGT